MQSEIITVRTVASVKQCPNCKAGMEADIFRANGEAVHSIMWYCEYLCGGKMQQQDQDDAILAKVNYDGHHTQTIKGVNS